MTHWSGAGGEGGGRHTMREEWSGCDEETAEQEERKGGTQEGVCAAIRRHRRNNDTSSEWSEGRLDSENEGRWSSGAFMVHVRADMADPVGAPTTRVYEVGEYSRLSRHASRWGNAAS